MSRPLSGPAGPAAVTGSTAPAAPTRPTVRLAGPRVALVPATRPVAVAVLAGDRDALGLALADLQLAAAVDWPHGDSADALRPLAEFGGGGGGDVGDGGGGGGDVGDGGGDGDGSAGAACWLVTVDGEVVGDCGWRPAVQGELELGYGLSAGSRGRGLATEAVGVLAAWADRQPGVVLLSADVLIGNEPSRRLLARLGFDQPERHGDYLRFVRPVSTRARPTGRHVC